jgi:anti-sigma B factor antagonist
MRNIFRHEDGEPFKYIKSIEETDKLVIIRFRGAVDSDTIPLIKQNIAKRRERFLDKNILADFKEVTHVDSATLAAMVKNLNDIKNHHRKLGIINMHQDLRDYLKIDRIEDLFDIYDTEEAALQVLAF